MVPVADPGGALIWTQFIYVHFWDTYVEEYSLDKHLSRLALFETGVDFNDCVSLSIASSALSAQISRWNMKMRILSQAILRGQKFNQISGASFL